MNKHLKIFISLLINNKVKSNFTPLTHIVFFFLVCLTIKEDVIGPFPPVFLFFFFQSFITIYYMNKQDD